MDRLIPSDGTRSVAVDAAAHGEHLASPVVLERVSDGFVALDRDWRYTYVNERAGQIFGRRPAELIGKHIWTEFPEAVGQPFHLAYERAMATQQFTYLEAYYAPYDGWFENRIYPSVDGLSIFFHDITDRKRVEALLVSQNELLEMIATGAPMSSTLDALVRRIEAHVPAMRGSVLLLDRDGVRLRHGAAPSLPEEYVRAIDGSPIGPCAGSCGTSAFRAAPVIVRDIAIDPLWEDYRHLALPHDLRACWSTPILDTDGRVLGTFAMYYREPREPQDWEHRVTDAAVHIAAIAIARERVDEDRRQVEQKLRESEARLAEAQRMVGLGRFEIDPKTRTYHWTDQIFHLHGLPPGGPTPSMEGFLDLVHPDDRETIADYYRAFLRGRSDESVEYRTNPARGRVRYLSAAVHTVRDSDGRALRLVGTVLDITARKERELIRLRNAELEERNHTIQEASRLKSQFVASMSHELRTPLNAIIGFSEFLIDQKPGPLNARQLEYLNDVLSSGRHLLRLINDVLDLAKIEAGKLELVPEPFSLPEAIAEVCSVARALARKKDLSLQVSNDPAVETVVLDCQRVKQVLFNLLSNAVKFTEPGGRIDVVTRQRVEGRFEIQVRDTGIGIRREDLGKLFGEFQQIDGGTGRHHEGTGLGLALSKRIVESMGGTIVVESEPNVGSTFSVVLPNAMR